MTRIAVIAHALHSAGGLTVGRNVIGAMLEVSAENEYCFLIPDGVGYEEICARAPRSEVHAIEAMGPVERVQFDRSRLPRILGDFEPDVVLALDSSHSIRKSPWPQAVLVHDAHLVYPRSYFGPLGMKGRLRHAYLRHHFRGALASTEVIFVQTQVMESRLRGAFGFSGAVIVLGASTSESLLQQTASSEPPPGILPYAGLFKFICVTRYAPHKNLERIVDVFRENRDDLANVVVFVTISPEQHPRAARMLRQIGKLGLDRRIVNLGEVPHEAIGPYYEHCDALLMPTTLESFGYPYVEAMAFGLPILASDLDFSRATCGDAAVYFKPWDVQDMRDAMLRVSADVQLRNRLSQAGIDRAIQNQSWTQVAEIILNGLRDISR